MPSKPSSAPPGTNCCPSVLPVSRSATPAISRFSTLLSPGAVEVLVTGDKDFLALAINRPLILTARQYLETVESGTSEG